MVVDPHARSKLLRVDVLIELYCTATTPAPGPGQAATAPARRAARAGGPDDKDHRRVINTVTNIRSHMNTFLSASASDAWGRQLLLPRKLGTESALGQARV